VRSSSEIGAAVTRLPAAAQCRVAYEILRGGLHRDGEPVPIPKGLLYLLLARAGWKGRDGPLSAEFVRRLRRLDPRLPHLYLPDERESAA
jgi:hypothetical protein